MAVHDRGFKAYSGDLTPEWSRFLIIPRYAFRDVFKSRLFTGFLFLCFVVPMAFFLVVYLHHNAAAPQVLRDWAAQVFPIDAGFFRTFLEIQAWSGFVVAIVVGPALISPDLRHNGLPLFLCRPFSASEYILGKFSVLAIILSMVTWMTVFLVFLFQSYLAGVQWTLDNLQIGAGILVGGWFWVVLFSLMPLALSALVKWRTFARFTFLVVFFVFAGFGLVLNVVLRTRWGSVLNLRSLYYSLWSSLMGIRTPDQVPLAVTVFVLLSLFFGCLIVLWRRLCAYEVVT